jgi:hypothetical protein
LPFVVTEPRWTVVPELLSSTVNESLLLLLVKLTRTVVLDPFQPLHTDVGSIASEYVKVTVSPFSIFPAVPPLLLVATTLVAVGLVVSTVKVFAVLVPVLPAVSVCVACAV